MLWQLRHRGGVATRKVEEGSSVAAHGGRSKAWACAVALLAAGTAGLSGLAMAGREKLKGCTAKTGYACIGGYTPAQVPNLAALAHRFAISDRTFSMADSPSWGGHLYAVMGSLDGFEGGNPFPAPGVPPGPGWGCDSKRITPWKAPDGAVQRVPSCVPDYSLGLPNGGAFMPTPAEH